MNPPHHRLAAALASLLLAALAQLPAPALERVPNTTLALPLTPPVFGYTSTNALGTMTFTNVVCLASPPGETNRLFLLEKRGRILVITNLAAPTRTVFLDLTARVAASDTVSDERGLLGLAFHPGYATNRQFYVFYTGNATTTPGTGLHDILARFHASASNPNQGDPASELRLLLQRDEASNHNGGDLHFGPDGYLYVSLGDEGGGNDDFANSQRITKDFCSGLLRLDVDARPGSLAPNPHPAATAHYRVPPDNPFVGATTFNGLPVNPAQVRTEFWAVGLRNPWRFSFDPDTGLLYLADVGQSSREEVNLIARGGNYGWSYWEGFLQRTNSANIPAGFVHSPPMRDHPRSEAQSITGGRVYRGQNLAQLHGAYVYADYLSGRMWALRQTNGVVSSVQQLLTETSIVAFGTDPRNGDLLYARVRNGTNAIIQRLTYASTFSGTPIPPTLAQTGAFSDLATLTPHAGIVPYDLNVPFWSDGARKTRWFSVPKTNLTMTFSPESNWTFPTGTVWIKHFELELTNGLPASARRLETRFLVQNAHGGYGVTYRWGEALTNAALVAEGGLNETFVLHDAGGAVIRTQDWRYPSRTECMQCHTAAGGVGLGFHTAQLNRDFAYPDTTTNQLQALSDAGYFSAPLASRHLLPALARPDDETVSLEFRARSWLAANCVQCHQPGAAPMALFDTRLATPTTQAGLVDGAVVDHLGDPANRLLVPGEPDRSVLLTRIAALGDLRMPPIGSTVVDTQAVALLRAWITNDLPAWQSFATWQSNYFGATNLPVALATADPDEDGGMNYQEYLAGTHPLDPASVWKVGIEDGPAGPALLVPQPANRAIEAQAATALDGTPGWAPLNLPPNAPFYPASNRLWRIEVPAAASNQFHRVRLSEP
jgi:uncharacterized repeat protein (TIGR03806 family)